MKELFFKYRKSFVFGSIAVVFLIGMGAISLIMKQVEPYKEDAPVVSVEENKSPKEEKKTVSEVEKLAKPVADGISIKRYYYDSNYDDKKLEEALIYFEGVYRPNLGVDFYVDGKSFDVVAALSGTVTNKTKDALLGWVVTIESENKVSCTYQSLNEVKVEKGAKVKQGDLLGVSGENVYESDLKCHLHFVLEKDNNTLNPENYFGKEITKIS